MIKKSHVLLIFLSFLYLNGQVNGQVKNEYKEAKLLKGNYKQIVYFNQNKKTFESSGDFFIAEGYGICWFTKEPKESITVMGEKSMSQIFPNGDKKIISDLNNVMFSKIANIIKSIFTYDENAIKDSFVESEDEKGNIVYSPKSEDLKKILNKIEVKISKEGYIEKIKMFNRNGYTEYEMKVLYRGNEISDNEKKYFE